MPLVARWRSPPFGFASFNLSAWADPRRSANRGAGHLRRGRVRNRRSLRCPRNRSEPSGSGVAAGEAMAGLRRNFPTCNCLVQQYAETVPSRGHRSAARWSRHSRADVGPCSQAALEFGFQAVGLQDCFRCRYAFLDYRFRRGVKPGQFLF